MDCNLMKRAPGSINPLIIPVNCDEGQAKWPSVTFRVRAPVRSLSRPSISRQLLLIIAHNHQRSARRFPFYSPICENVVRSTDLPKFPSKQYSSTTNTMGGRCSRGHHYRKRPEKNQSGRQGPKGAEETDRRGRYGSISVIALRWKPRQERA